MMRFAAVAFAALAVAIAAVHAVPQPQERVRLAPRLEPGQTLRYQMDIRTTTEGSTEGPIEDPQAAGAVEISLSALVRFDVLEATAAGGGAVRLRATYEELAGAARGDLADPRAAELEEGFEMLRGRSLEFTLDAAGRVAEVTGLEDASPEQAAATREWLAQLSLGVSHPARGIAPGERWSASGLREITIPLRGYGWRTESAYLRNEPCRAAADSAAAAEGETCAVILTRLEVVDRGSRRNRTPEEYRSQGLRTAGTVSGSGESLSYVSLATGLVVSVTQTGAEEIDLTVSSEDGATRVRYRARIRSHSQITLLPAPPEQPAPPAL